MNKELYSDKNPKNTIKGLGYKNKEKAKFTIDRVKSYSIKYQFQVINTMYNRAKFHKNKTKEMEEAMKIFKKWLDKYKKNLNKESNKDEYEFLNLSKIKKYEKMAEKLKVSEVSRGVKKSKLSDKGFLEVYKEIKGKKNKNKLKEIPIKKSNPNGIDWYRKRDVQIKAKLSQIKKMKLKLFDSNGNPTKIHLNLIMWAYSPSKKI